MPHRHGAHGNDANRGRRLLIAVALNLGITIAEVAGGLISGSLALLADAAHNLSDAASVLVAYIAWRISQKAANERYTFGFRRAETVGAIINLTTLFVIGLYLIYEAVSRVFNPEEIDASIMLIVGVIALVEDVVAAWVLSKEHGLNIRAAMIHMIADAAATVGVIAGAIVIAIWGATWVDPAITAVIAIYIFGHGYHEIRKAIEVLMDTPPRGFDFDGLVHELRLAAGVEDIHHVHVWRPDEDRIALEAHLSLSVDELDEATRLKETLKGRLRQKFGIDHATIEIERAQAVDHGRKVIQDE